MRQRRFGYRLVALAAAVALLAAACAEDGTDEAAAASSAASGALSEAQTARSEASAANSAASAADAAAAAADATADAAAARAEEAIAAAQLAVATAEGNEEAVAAAEAALADAQAAATAAQAEAASAQADAAAAQAEAAAAQAEAAEAQAEAASAQAEAEAMIAQAEEAAAAAAEAVEAVAAEVAAQAAIGPDGLPRFGTPERCEANRAAGPLTFMTGFDLAAAAGIIEVVVAEDKGYFDDMCLDVEVQPGFAPGHLAAVAAGTVQVADAPDFGSLVRANLAGDVELVGFGQLGHTAINQLLVSPDSGITSLADIRGKTVGIKGDLPVAVQAMMAEEGLQRGEFTELLLEGFNPVEHFALGIDALPVYRSNEPRWLDLAGVDYITFDPLDYDVPASFAVIATRRDFYEAHPTAVEDFVRAGLRGYYFAAENPEAALDHAFERIEAAGNNLFFAREHELFRWTTDQKSIEEVTPEGLVIGEFNVAGLGREMELLVELGVFDELPDWRSMIDVTVIPKLYDGDELIWASMN